MTLSNRDKRALVALVAAAAVAVIIGFWPESAGSIDSAAGSDSVTALQQRLAKVRALAAEAPVKKQELGRLQGELGEFEKGLIRSETAQQAQAGLLQILRGIGSKQEPPLNFESEEIGQLRPLGASKDYGEALVSVSFTCGIEQLVNLLADLTAQQELVVTDELRITPQQQKEKTLRVRLTVAGLVPSRLLPKQPGLGAL